MFVPECDGKTNIKIRSENDNLYTAVAVVGDQFWNKGRTREFCMAEALKHDHKTMDNTFHNLDHAQTINAIVGTNVDTEYDDNGKRMIIHIRPNKNMPAYQTWRSFLDMCKETGKTPNVSIEAIVTCENIKASELPEGTDYKQYGIEDEDIVEIEKGYQFIATATVVMGACSDSDGCGINLNSMDCSCTDDTWQYDNKMETEIMSKKQPEVPEETKKEKVTEETTETKEETKNEESDLVLTLKERLVNCGETRKSIEADNESLLSEKNGLENKIKELDIVIQTQQAEIDELKTKLSKPVTKKQTETTKNENWRVDVVKKLMRME